MPLTHRLRIFPLIVVLTLLLDGCSGGDPRVPHWGGSASPDGSPQASASGDAAGTDPAARAAALVATLADEDLVGQVLMPYAYGSSATDVSSGSAAANRKLAGVATPAEMVTRYRLGGLILVGFSADDPTATSQPTTNVDSPEQVLALTGGLQQAAGRLPAAVPLLVGTDQEFGVVTRIRDGVSVLPSAMAAGAAGSPARTEAAWHAAGSELAALGITVDFAPVADVLGTGSAAGPIGSRAFGSDPKAVSDQVAAAVRGLQASGVAATLKHFPGHGRTGTDSHSGTPRLTQSRASLESTDLPPFIAGMDAGAELVMSGHLDVREIDPGTPASFSHRILTDLLRGELGFTGVVVTDALNMEPAKKWAPAEAARRALVAGNDLLLMPPDLPDVYDGLLAALRAGRLPRARLVEAATRVLTLKFRQAGHAAPALSVVGSSANQGAAAELAQAAVTVLRGSCQGALVGPTVTVSASKGRDTARDWLVAELRALGVSAEPITSSSASGPVVHLVGYGDAAGDLRSGAQITVAMDTPYLLAKSTSPVRMATYSSTRAAMAGLAQVLAGRAAATGRSPVPVKGLPRSACGD